MGFITDLLTALGIKPLYLFYGGLGLLIHFLKSWLAANRRNEVFFRQETYLFYLINFVLVIAMLGVGAELPDSLYTDSKLSSLMMGLSSSSVLSGFIKIKGPAELTPEDKVLLNITKSSTPQS